MPGSTSSFTTLGTTPMRIHQGSKVVEPICRHKPYCHKFPQSVFHFRRKIMCDPDQIGKEACALFLQSMTELLRHRT